MDKRVSAIRAHKLVGRGSCSSIDECRSDEDLTAALDEAKVAKSDVAGAIEWALDDEQMFLEQGLNCRFGEDDDEQLLIYRKFKEERKGCKAVPTEKVAGFLALVEANKDKAYQEQMDRYARNHEDFMKRVTSDQQEADLLNRGG